MSSALYLPQIKIWLAKVLLSTFITSQHFLITYTLIQLRAESALLVHVQPHYLFVIELLLQGLYIEIIEAVVSICSPMSRRRSLNGYIFFT